MREVQGVELEGVVWVEVVVVVLGGEGEAAVGCWAVGGCVRAELVDFDAHEGEGGPGGEGPWSAVRGSFHVSGGVSRRRCG